MQKRNICFKGLKNIFFKDLKNVKDPQNIKRSIWIKKVVSTLCSWKLSCFQF